MKKKFLALFMAIAMVLTMVVPTVASAPSYDEAVDDFMFDYEFRSSRGTVEVVEVYKGKVYFDAKPKSLYDVSKRDITVTDSLDNEYTVKVDNDSDSGYGFYFTLDDEIDGYEELVYTIDVDFSYYYDDDDDDYYDDEEYYISVLDHNESYVEISTNKRYAEAGENVRIDVDYLRSGYIATITVVAEFRVGDSDYEIFEVDHTDETCYFSMPAADVYIDVEYERDDDASEDDDIYEIEVWVNDEDLGTVTIDDSIDTDDVDEGDLVTIWIDPETDCEVDEIRVVGNYTDEDYDVTRVEVDEKYKFEMPDEDVTVYVWFADEDGDVPDGDYDEDWYEIRDIEYNSSRGDVYVDDDEYEAGNRVWIDITPDDGYEIGTVSVTKRSGGKVTVKQGSSYYYFTMPSSDVYIEVTFVKEGSGSGTGNYDIKLDYNDDLGEVTLSHDSADRYDTVKIYITTENKIKDVTVYTSRGKAVTVTEKSSYYYFTMPAYDVTVEVDFEETATGKYNIELNYDKTIATAVASAKKSNAGANITISTDYAKGIRAVNVTNKTTGEKINAIKTSRYYYFTMPAADVTVDVKFVGEAEPTYTITKGLTQNGTINVSASSAEAGTRITVTPVAAAGYVAKNISVTKANGAGPVVTLKNADGTFTFMMPEANVSVLVTFEKSAVTPTVPGDHANCPSKAYKDVDTTQWYHEAVDYAISTGLITGDGAGNFMPNANTSRAIVVTILYRMAGSPSVSGTVPYTDVPANEWYTNAVRWAYQKGLLANIATGAIFSPNTALTREQFAFMLYTYDSVVKGNNHGLGVRNLDFVDLSKMTPVFGGAVMWCNEKGIINGNEKKELDPQGAVVRATLAKMLMVYNSIG